jgi:hypothetical protein
MHSLSASLPAKPPRSSRFGRNARTKLATVAMIFVSAARGAGKDPGEMLTAAIRDAAKGRPPAIQTVDLEGMGPTEMVDASSILALACRPLKLDLSDERTAESVEEYTRRCVELYRGMQG